MLDQRRVGRVEIVAGSQVSQQMRCHRSERIMPVVQPRTGLVDRNTQLLVLIAMPFQLRPIAGREQYTISVENVSTPDLARQRIEPRVSLRPLDSVVFKD